MSDSFADLWNSAAPSKQTLKPQKLSQLSAQPQNKLFSPLSNPKAAAPKPHADAFSSLFDAGSSNRSTANMSIAERAALAEKERLQKQSQSQSMSTTVPSTWDGLDSLAGKSVPVDDWGLDDFANPTRDSTDDILGDLSRPIESFGGSSQLTESSSYPPEFVQAPSPIESFGHSTLPQDSLQKTTSPPPHILGQLIEMGFSVNQARTALASTETGQDVPAALEILISNGAADSYSTPRRTPSPQQPQLHPRRDQQPGLQTDKLLTQASEIGLSLFNRANAAWKEGKGRVQKAYEERVGTTFEDERRSGRSTPTNTRPKWMQDNILDASLPTQKSPPKPSPKDEIDLFSDAPVYVSKFRHTKSKVPPPSFQQLPPAPHPSTAVSASASAISSSQQSKASGTEFFKLGDFPAAEKAYTRAIGALPPGHALLIPLYNNRALVRLKVGDTKGVVNDTGLVEKLIGGPASLREELRRGSGGKINLPGAKEEVNLGDALVKAWKRRAEAMEGREKWEEAGKDWERVAGAEWASQNIRTEGARGAGRCRKMQQQGIERSKPKSIPNSVRPPPRRGVTPPSQALDSLRAANKAAESEDLQRHALKDSVEARLQAWKGGKETNIRALLASLDTILWPELGVQKLSMAELIGEGQVKVKYMKSIAKVHPDKLNLGNSTLEQRMIASGVFGTLNEAWNAFKP